ncbi:MAG TPA: cytochrome c biogenesis protein CcsA [Vicinamibacteria bacterium]|nr:cytochrome c biogenesis protein CcsA [Vicinamibacteria bacterium]
MQSAINALTIILPTLYALLWADYALLFFRNDPFAEKTTPILLRVSVGLHAALLVLRTLRFHHFPFATVFEAMSVVAFSVAVLYLLIEARIGVRTTGYLILGIVFVFQLVSSAFGELPTSFSELLWEPAFMVHVSTALLGYSGMAVSAVYGALYLMLFYDIKHHRFGLIYKQLPSLEVMGSFMYRAAWLGLGFLTVAMIGGLVLLVRVYGTYWSWDPKLMITFAVWLIYGLGLSASRLKGWSAKRVAFTSIAGFAVVLFSFVVVNLVFSRFHVFI